MVKRPFLYCQQRGEKKGAEDFITTFVTIYRAPRKSPALSIIVPWVSLRGRCYSIFLWLNNLLKASSAEVSCLWRVKPMRINRP